MWCDGAREPRVTVGWLLPVRDNLSNIPSFQDGRKRFFLKFGRKGRKSGLKLLRKLVKKRLSRNNMRIVYLSVPELSKFQTQV